jgi:hypothetical protein
MSASEAQAERIRLELNFRIDTKQAYRILVAGASNKYAICSPLSKRFRSLGADQIHTIV